MYFFARCMTAGGVPSKSKRKIWTGPLAGKAVELV